jgi:PKD domain/Secretion system C-terminal sorting domain
MKGFLPFSRRVLSPRNLFLPFLFFILSSSGVQAKTVVIGAGFGNISQNNMSGLNPGDVLAIKPGTYTGAYFMNLNGITITNNGGTVIFTGTVTMDGLQGCTFSNVQFKNVPGISIRWENNSRRCTEKNISFYNCAGSCNDATDHNPYTGDTSSLKLYMCTFDSLTLFKSGQIMMANYGDAKSGVAYVDSIVFSRMKVDSTTTDGTEVRGVFFRIDAHDWVVNYTGFNQLSGDVGMVYMIGSGKIHNLYKNGGRGYISRARVVGLGKSQNIYFYNNIDLNSYDYGMIDARTEPDQVTQYTYDGNCYIYNNTAGNLADHMGYWASIAVVGTFSPPFNCEVKNNLGFNQMTNGKSPIVANQSSNTWVTDSSNNLYFAKPDGVVDPVTGVPLAGSPVLGKGLTVPWITEDIYHTARTGAYDIGAVQHGGSPIPPPPNKLPVAVAGATQTITLPVSTASLDGTKSYDPDGSISSYAWSLVSGPGGTIANAAAASTTVSGLTQGTYVFKLTVTDNSNATASTMDTIIVKAAANLPPNANAGADQTITLPANSVNVDGSASKDQDNGGLISSYAWSQSSGPSTATIATSTKATTTISGLQLGTYVFKLVVTDASGATASDSLVVTVKAAANLPPIANAGADQTITLPVNSVNADGSASKDQDNGGLISSYAWSQSSGPSSATIGTATKATTAISGLVQGTYIFKLVVTDASGATASDSLVVTVKAAANIPPVANAGTSKSITLPVNSVNLDGSLSTDADGTITSYSWAQISGPSTSSIANATSAQTAVNNLIAGLYTFELTVTDNAGAISKAQVKITVSSAGIQPPVANAGANQTIQLPVNQVALDGTGSAAPSGSITGYSWTQVSGPSSASWSAPTASKTNATALVAGTYVFQLTITDNNNAKATDQVTITVTAAVNIPPVANAGASIIIDLPANTATLDGSKSSDADGSITTYSWSMVSGPNTPGSSGANSSTLSLTGLVAGQYSYQLTVTDNSGATATAQVKVTVVAQQNILPVANAGSSITITLPTNTATLDGTKSSDADGTISKYSWTMISGPNTPAATGATTSTLSLSGLVAGQYVYQLTVTDNNGGSASAQVKITVVSPANKVPVANAGNDQTITAPASSVNLDGSASYDPDGTIASYSWVLKTGTGSITISNGNTSKPSVAGLTPGTYSFQLTVTDNSGASSTALVTITVNSQPPVPNQAPVANAGNNQTITAPTASIVLNGSSSFDPDGTITKYTWTQVSGPNTAVILGNGTVSPSVSGLVVGTYTFQLLVTDNDGATNTDQVTVTVAPAVSKVNLTPVANAGSDTTINLPTNSFQLNANGSYDPDGNIANYQWQEISGPNTAAATSMFGSQVDIGNLEAGLYEFEVTVTDNTGGKSTATVKITVDDPTAAKGADQLILFPNPAHDVITGKLTSSINGTIKVNVYDMNGRLVYVDQTVKSSDIYQKTYDISMLAPGTYSIQIIIGNKKTMITKFIKQ